MQIVSELQIRNYTVIDWNTDNKDHWTDQYEFHDFQLENVTTEIQTEIVQLASKQEASLICWSQVMQFRAHETDWWNLIK